MIINCELDGTLCLFKSHRSPYDTAKGEDDLLCDVVSELINGKNVILVSGREDKFREKTERWLTKHNIEYIDLFMRQTGDNRNDAVVKQEIYDNHIKGKYDINFVLDDRDRVVKMWRDNGLKCLQVAEGNF